MDRGPKAERTLPDMLVVPFSVPQGREEGQREMRRRAVLLLTVMTLAVVATASPAWAATFTVNQTGDEDDLDFPGGTFDGSSDGVCDITLSIAGNQCTLRAAIQAANANDNAPTVDLISFDIPGDGPHVIAPASDELPAITEPVTIDGYTQGDLTSPTTDDAKENTRASGTNADLRIELRGASATPGSNGLTISGGRTIVRGLVIIRFQRTGSGSGGHAISFSDTAGNTNNRVEGNFLGTNRTGTTAEPNTGVAVVAEGPGTASNTIGGATPASRNLISANDQAGQRGGVELDASDANTIRGNLIGTKSDGTGDLGAVGGGVLIADASDNTIGGTDAGDGAVDGEVKAANVIAGNRFDGVLIFGASATGNNELSNRIFSNGELGVDLGPNGVTNNDTDDPDTGPNNLQNFPVITSVVQAATFLNPTRISGTLNSTPNRDFTVQCFLAGETPEDADAGHGEGRSFVAEDTDVRTDSGGDASFECNFFCPVPLEGKRWSATATNETMGGTSEFSANFPAE
jgi:hypothetical protein